jgi:hypothetical protein
MIGMTIAFYIRKLTWLGAGLVGAIGVHTVIWVFGFGSYVKSTFF